MMKLRDTTWTLAPMDGLTDYRYRNALYSVFPDIDRVVAPFITLVPGKKVKISHLKDLLPSTNLLPLDKLEPQILGNEEEYLESMIKSLSDLGYTCMNWNLGCPVKSVANKQRGSGLLKFSDRIDSFLNKAFSVGGIKISIKIRLGYDNAREAFDLLNIINKYPLEYVVIHPRLGLQMYNGSADIKAFKVLNSEIRHRCVYNGDIFTVDKAREVLENLPNIDEFMIGRGVLMNPFLPSLLKNRKFKDEEVNSLFWKFVKQLYLQHLNSNVAAEKVLHKQKQLWAQFKFNNSGLGVFEDPENEYYINTAEILGKVKYVKSLDEYIKFCKIDI